MLSLRKEVGSTTSVARSVSAPRLAASNNTLRDVIAEKMPKRTAPVSKAS
jgi:hypothetical protein